MARRFKIRFKKKINIPRVVAKVAGTIIGLYVGGVLVNEIGDMTINNSGSFYPGLKLVGFTVGNPTTNGTTYCYFQCNGGGTQELLDASCNATAGYTTTPTSTCVTATGGTGILAIVGIVGIASIIMEFINFSL